MKGVNNKGKSLNLKEISKFNVYECFQGTPPIVDQSEGGCPKITMTIKHVYTLPYKYGHKFAGFF